MKKFGLVLIVLWTATPVIAVESYDAQTAKAFGLLGTWARDCSAIMSEESFIPLVSRDGKVSDYSWEDGGDEFSNFQRIGPRKLRFKVIRWSDGEISRFVVELQRGRLRFVEMPGSQGRVNPDQWYEKCSSETNAPD